MLAAGPREVTTTAGDVAGSEVTDGATGARVLRFAGIPYAAAPVGERRFRPPAPVDRWDGVRPTTAFGPSAPQRTSGPLVEAVPGMRVGPMSEDCLTLNVWTPAGAGPGDGLPVLVWIHGGAFVIGGSSLETYDATHLSGLHDAVVVSCNYRLGALGFLTLPEPAAGVIGASANLALLDQLMALRWVQDNIAAFGGNPDTTTVFGESAGAGCLLHQLGAPATAGLVRRAILQSPGAETTGRELAEELAGAFLRRAGVPAHEPERLHDLAVADILDAQDGAAEDLARSFGAMPWSPVIDGDILPSAPQGRIAGGAAKDVATIVGTTSAELRLYAGPMAKLPPKAVAAILRHLLRPVVHHDPGREAALELVQAYATDDQDPVDLYTDVLSDAAMGIPAMLLADDLATHQPRTYAYRFDWSAPVIRAFHACDLPFTFATLDRCGWDDFVGADDDAVRLADDIGAAWVAFARGGDPSTPRLGDWPAYERHERRTMLLGRRCQVVEHPLAERLHLHVAVREEPERT